MFNFLHKDLLLHARDYKELGLLLLMPIILIVILGLALGSLLEGGGPNLNTHAALVIEDDVAAGHAAFTASLASSGLPLPQRLALGAAATTIDPIAMLEGLLNSPELANLLTVTTTDAATARAQLASDDLQAVITVPAGFSAAQLEGMLLGGGGAQLQLAVSDSSPLRASILQGVLDGYARSVSFQSALGGVLQGAPPAGPHISGGIETIAVTPGVSSVAYYTLGMAVMFTLFVAGSVAARAFLERSSLTFDRIIISGANRFAFLLSKLFAGVIVVMLQLAFLFVAATLLLGAFRNQSVSFWAHAALVSVLLVACVGALGVLLTALNYRAGSARTSTVFSSVVVTLFSLLGGSFFTVSDVPLLANLGKWTPNGAALNAYLSVVQGQPLSSYWGNLVRLVVLTALLLAVGYALFPRRGGN